MESTQEERGLEQVRLVSAVSRRLVSILDVEQLLTQVADLIHEAFDYYLVIFGLVEGDQLVIQAGAGRDWQSTTVGFRTPVGGPGVMAWVASSGEPLIVEDNRQEERYVEVPGASSQSMIAVPMIIRDQVAGVLNIESDRLNAFDESDLQMLTALASQVGVAFENARLFEAEERRVEQFWVLNEVGRKIASILDIDQLLDEIVSLIQEAFGYHHVGIGLIEGDYVAYRSGAGALWDDPDYSFRPAKLKVGEQGLTGWVAAHGEPLLVSDVSTDPRYVEMRGSQTQSELVLPIQVRGETVGVLDIQSRQLDDFDKTDIQLLQSLANQAGVALENASLFKAEHRLSEHLAVITEVGQHLTAILPTDDLLWEIAKLASEALGYTSLGIGLIDRERLLFRAGVGAYWERIGQREKYVDVNGPGITAWVARHGKPYLASYVEQDPVFLQDDDFPGTAAELAVPIKIKDTILGVIDIQSDQTGDFDQRDITVLQSLANQAAIAIENLRLYSKTRQLAVLEERQRLARELHDSVTQDLYGVTMYAEAAARMLAADQEQVVSEYLRELKDTASDALREMRLLIFELRPSALQEVGLEAALQTRLEAVEGRAGLTTELTCSGEIDLPPEYEEGLYGIAREALNNALRHSQANHIQIRLHCDGRRCLLEIEDDGLGFELEDELQQGGFGLHGMYERAASIGAQLTIGTQPEGGTLVQAEVEIE
jgi:signal transduction histidine kinase